MPDSPLYPFIHRKVIALRETASAYEAVRAMCEQNVGSVLVTDGEGLLAGIVTDRDLTCATATFDNIQDARLGDVMTVDLATVREQASVDEVLNLMKERGIRRVPVVHELKEGGQRCIGMVSLDDLIAAGVVSTSDLSSIIRAQIFRRRNAQPGWESDESRADREAGRFLNELAGRSGLGVARAQALADLVIGLVVRRLHFTSAASLIDHVPERFRSRLLDLPAGPDRSITGDTILREVSARFDVDQTQAKKLIGDMWNSLVSEQSVPSAADVAEELPDDLRAVLIELPEGGQRPLIDHPTGPIP